MGAGRPKGSTKPRVMAEALSIALNRESLDDKGNKTRNLALIASKLINLALSGDLAAIKEVNDRVDGKAIQSIGGDPENPLELRGLSDADVHARILLLSGKLGITGEPGGTT